MKMEKKVLKIDDYKNNIIIKNYLHEYIESIVALFDMQLSPQEIYIYDTLFSYLNSLIFYSKKDSLKEFISIIIKYRKLYYSEETSNNVRKIFKWQLENIICKNGKLLYEQISKNSWKNIDIANNIWVYNYSKTDKNIRKNIRKNKITKNWKIIYLN